MYNMNVMKGTLCKWLGVSVFLLVLLFCTQKTEAAVYTDSLTFKIDSAKIEGDFLEYSVMFWRTNESWVGDNGKQDTLLGNTDLNFWLEDVVFDKNVAPQIVRKHADLDLNTAGGFALMNIEARYYAYRFSIKISPKENPMSNMRVVSVLYNQPVELCRVRLKMTNPNQNPGLEWDVKATGGQSTIGEPLILALDGNVRLNPQKDIILVDNSHVQWVCEGGEAKVWAKGHSSGDKLKIAWYMAGDPDCVGAYNGNPNDAAKFTSNITGNLVSGQVHVADYLNTAKWGKLRYHITCANDGLERVDTLHIFNVPISMDSIYFQCELSDASLSGAPRYSSNTANGTDNQKTQLLVRDSLHGWFASSDPTRRDDGPGGIGASDRTDTVMRCPSIGAVVSFYFFGPDCDADHQIIGSYMDVTYQWQDALGASDVDTYRVSSWEKVSGKNAPNGKCLYKGSVLLAQALTDKLVWIRSISTEAGCNNGSSYRKYDTLYVKDLPQDQTLVATLTDTTLSAGESMTLRPGFDGYTLKQPALGSVNTSAKTYTAPATSCSDPDGCRDTLVYKYTMNIGEGTNCQMEFQQVVNLSDVYYLSLKVLLEGGFAYSSTNLMVSYPVALFPRDASGYYTSPYCDQKVAVMPSIATPAEGDITDWIYIQLRDVSNIGNLFESIDSVSAIVRQDGTVFSMDGKPYVTFKNLAKTKYHVVVTHRNHVGVMSKEPIELKTSVASLPSTPLIDFTNLALVYVSDPTIPVMYLLPDGRAALFVGDVTEDGFITVPDANEIIFNMSSTTSDVYRPSDLDFDGVVNASDYNRCLNNLGKKTQY